MPVKPMNMKTKNAQRAGTNGKVCVMMKYNPPKPMMVNASAGKPNDLNSSFSSIERIILVGDWRVEIGDWGCNW